VKIPATFNEATSSNGILSTLTGMFRSNIREYGMLIALIAVMVFFQIRTDGILMKPINITNLVLQNSYVIIMALGMLLIIVSGWIDLSVGSVAAFIGAIAGVMIVKWGWNWGIGCWSWPFAFWQAA
jgi:putative multiple sugar transport system permease protein